MICSKTLHPKRCETCNKRATDDCPLSTVANNIGRHGDYARIVSVIRIIGCASHSSSGAPALLPAIPDDLLHAAYKRGWDAAAKDAREQVLPFLEELASSSVSDARKREILESLRAQ